jgi:hypothetical protein
MVSSDVMNKTLLIQPLVVIKKNGELIKRDLMVKSRKLSGGLIFNMPVI